MGASTRFEAQASADFPTDFDDFIKLLDEISVDLRLLWDHVWHMKVTLSHFGSLWVHLGVNLGPLWAYRGRMACMMCIVAGLIVSWSDPNGSKNKIYSLLRTILPFKKATSSPEKLIAE